MRKKFALPSFIALTSMSLVGTIVGSLAWLSDKADISTNSNLDGSSDGAYFAYGNGDAADDPSTPYIIEGPYGIETARQLYNLAWLQYLGYFNKADPNTGVITPVYFELNADIDMTGWILPPIGTTQYPFIGNFTGKTLQGYDEETGAPIYKTHTVSNLVTSNNYDQILDSNKLPGRIKKEGEVTNADIVGMFGVVGSLNNVPNTAKYDTSVTSIRDFYLDGATITSTSSNTLIGLVAGYVNGPLSNVGVSNSNINEKEWINKSGQTKTISAVSNLGNVYGENFANISDFGIVGYCEDEYKEEMKTLKSDVYNTVNAKGNYVAQDEGDQSGWGGSIDMKTTYDGLHNVFDQYAANNGRRYKYPTTKEYEEDINGNVVTKEYGPSNTEYSFYTANAYHHYFSYSQYAGENNTKQSSNYTIAQRNGTDRYMYIYGKNDITLDDVVTVNATTYPEVDNCFYLSFTEPNSTTHHLTRNGTTGVNDQTDSRYATSWNIDDNNRIYTIVDGTTPYYLDSNNTTLSVTTTADNAKQWTWNQTQRTMSYVDGKTTYYLCYANGWTIKSIEEQYYTFYSNSRYLGTSGTSITALASVTDQAKWYLDSTGYYQMYNNQKYYLGSSRYAQIQFATNPYLTLVYSDSYLYVDGNSTYRAYCNNGTWTIQNNTTQTVTRTSGGGGDPTEYSIVMDTSAPNFKKKTPGQQYKEDYTFTTEDTYFPLRQQTDDEYDITNGYNFSYTTGGKTYYMVYDTSATNNLGVTEKQKDATLWIEDGGYYYPYGYDDMWLNSQYNNAIIRCTNSTYRRYSFANNQLSVTISNTKYYAYYNGTQWAVDTSARAMNRTDAQYKRLISSTPNGIPKDTNTGYIIGGANDANIQGNIRVSQYFGKDNDYPYSLSDITEGSDGKITIDNLYTINTDNMVSSLINPADYSSYKKLEKSKESLEKVLTNDKEWVYGLHFMESEIEYGKTYDSGGELIEDKSVYAPYAIINGDEKTNYELPKNCIDFNLKEKGYINFIAGAYFGAYNSSGYLSYANNCFFTIQEIQRAADESISLIRPIKAIYSDGVSSHSYIYEYEEYDNQGTNKQFSKPFKLEKGIKKTLDNKDYTPYSSVAALESDGTHPYTKLFNVDWISSSASLRYERVSQGGYYGGYYFRGAPYYFELPMNMGEYAMGAPSFSGAQGAYLMYLDIGANAKQINRTSITEYWEELESITTYAAGVGFVVAAGNTVSDKNSFCVMVKQSYNGILSFDKVGDEDVESGVMYGDATYTDSPSSSNVELVYRNGSLKVNKDAQGKSEEPNVETTTTQYRRLTYYDYNSNSDSIIKIIVTDKKLSTAQNWTRISVEKYANFDVETNTGTKDDTIVIYANDGSKVEDASDIDIDTTSNTQKIISFSNYYPGVGTITVTSILTVVKVIDDDTSFTYVDVTGINFSVVLTRDDGKTTDITSLCKVTAITNPYGGVTYAFKINTTNITTEGQEITIELTTGS